MTCHPRLRLDVYKRSRVSMNALRTPGNNPRYLIDRLDVGWQRSRGGTTAFADALFGSSRSFSETLNLVLWP